MFLFVLFVENYKLTSWQVDKLTVQYEIQLPFHFSMDKMNATNPHSIDIYSNNYAIAVYSNSNNNDTIALPHFSFIFLEWVVKLLLEEGEWKSMYLYLPVLRIGV